MNFQTAGVVASIFLATATARTIYKFAARLAKSASPGAKRDVRDFLINLRMPSDPSLVIRHIREAFQLAFGRSHISLRCAVLSSAVTTIYFVFFGTLMYVKYLFDFPPEIRYPTPYTLTTTFTIHGVAYKFRFFLCAFASALIFDYLSLGKGRYVLQKIHQRTSFSTDV